MSVPSEMPVRQFLPLVRTRVRVAQAVAWEALVDCHREQALQFIGEFASRVTPLEALELYLGVVPVSAAMHEAIRTRTLATLELDHLPPQGALPVLRGWRVLRPDLIVKLIRYRRAYHERTLELAKMVGARAAEAVVATHVRNAQAFAELLTGQLTVGRAVAEYVAAFHLPLGVGQTVMQRVKAAAAGSELALEYSRPVVPDAELGSALEGEEPLSPPLPPAPRSSPSAASA